MAFHRTRSSSTHEPARLVTRPRASTPSIAPPPTRPAAAAPRAKAAPRANRTASIDWFLWVLWAILIAGFAGVSFIVYAIILGPVAG